MWWDRLAWLTDCSAFPLLDLPSPGKSYSTSFHHSPFGGFLPGEANSWLPFSSGDLASVSTTTQRLAPTGTRFNTGGPPEEWLHAHWLLSSLPWGPLLWQCVLSGWGGDYLLKEKVYKHTFSKAPKQQNKENLIRNTSSPLGFIYMSYLDVKMNRAGF